MNNPDDLITRQLFKSFDAMFQTNACEGQLPLNLRHYPRSDAQIEADQNAFERLQDREDFDDDATDVESAGFYGIRERGPI